MIGAHSTGDELVAAFRALSNPHRLRIVAALVNERLHVSQLAREVGLSRPLVHMHVRKLEDAGLVTGQHEVSREGRAMRFLEVTQFALHLTPELIVEASATLTDDDPKTNDNQKES